MAMVWPWDISYDTGAFECSVPLEKVSSGGSLYVQLFVKEEDSVSREKVENLEMPGEDAMFAMGWLVSVPEKAEGGLLATELAGAGAGAVQRAASRCPAGAISDGAHRAR